MTFQQRVQGVQALGFTARQARFLATVALHSGYCLRRQYVAFAGTRYGQNVRDFLDTLTERHLAERFSLRADRGYVYHLHARTIYRALRQEDNRNRRDASAAVIARKLMLLDYVLAHHEAEWLAAEEDKVEWFATCVGVPMSDLPQRVYVASTPGAASTTRYFPHKLPICLTGDPPTARFVYLVAEESGAGFEPFLLDHAALLRRLPAWTVVAVAPRTSPGLADCERAFARFVEQPLTPILARPDDLQWFFRTRQIVDRGEFARLSVADLNRFRTLRDAFTASVVEPLYRDWLVRGDQAVISAASTAPRAARPVGTLVTDVLPFDYSQFGSLPGVA